MGKTFRWNWLDTGIVALLGLSLLGVVLVQSGQHQTSAERIEGETDVLMTVWIHNTTLQMPHLFKAGEDATLTIRNQPRGTLKIVSATEKQRQIVVPQAQGYQLVDDPTMPDTRDYWITLQDKALVTTDGYVSNGIKLKAGLPIEIEGFAYRLKGYLTAVTPLDASPTEAAKVQAKSAS